MMNALFYVVKEQKLELIMLLKVPFKEDGIVLMKMVKQI